MSRYFTLRLFAIHVLGAAAVAACLILAAWQWDRAHVQQSTTSTEVKEFAELSPLRDYLPAASVSVPTSVTGTWQPEERIVMPDRIADGPSMAAAFALGAEGVQMGTRMLSCAESPVHNNWKDAIVNSRETDTVFLNQQGRPALRALKTELTAGLEPLGKFNIMEHMANLQALYFGGDMEAAIPLQGQVGGRIDSVLSAQEIIDETMAGFNAAINNLNRQYGQ